MISTLPEATIYGNWISYSLVLRGAKIMPQF